MRNGFSFITGLLAAAAVVGLAPLVRAQNTRQTLTQYYDSARTQPRIRYQVQLRGAHPDTVPHGSFRRYWPGGSLAEYGRFTDGQPDSVWTRYYPTAPGQPPAVARRLPMRAGQPEGPFVVFHPDGQVAQRGSFRQGQLADSLVTVGRDGQPRLLARFDSSCMPGLCGTFRQWHGAYSLWGYGLNWIDSQGEDLSSAYPSHDPARYWTGQLGAGQLVGALTEHDADGEPRIRVSYTAQGQLRLTTVYYPAAWLRIAQSQYQPLPADSIVHSRPLYEWQAVGQHPYLLQRYWPYSYGSTSDIAEVQLFQVVPHKPGEYLYISDVVGVLSRPVVPAPLPVPLATDFMRSAPARPARACSGLAAQYLAHGQPPLKEVTVADGSVIRRYPSLRSYQPLMALQKLSDPGRWQLGEADTLGVDNKPARQRVTPLADGRRLVETRRATRTYLATGKLESVSRRGLLHVTDRSYYPSGTRKEKTSAGLLGTFSRSWDEAGQLTHRDYESPVDLGRLRKRLKQAHPLRTLKRKLRRFQPLQPLYRAIRHVFPRHDHHTPRPSKH